MTAVDAFATHVGDGGITERERVRTRTVAGTVSLEFVTAAVSCALSDLVALVVKLQNLLRSARAPAFPSGMTECALLG